MKKHILKDAFQTALSSRVQQSNNLASSGLLLPSGQAQATGNQQPATRTRPLIIPVFLPHNGCPHRCIFCNQETITSTKKNLPDTKQLHLWINKFLKYPKKQTHPVQIAYYGGNFLGLKTKDIKRLLTAAFQFVKNGQVDGIRFSTRPDTISSQTLDIIKPYPVAAIELGVQSMDDQVLAAANRGHTSFDTQHAVERLKSRDYTVGLQMMVGLPGDDEAKALATGRRIVDLSPDFVRIYPTVVLARSPLAVLYQQGRYTPWPLNQCVTVVKKLYLMFANNSIPVIRMGLQSSEDLEEGSTILAGPYHPAFGHLVYSEIFLDRAEAAIEPLKGPFAAVNLKVHPRNISKMRGLNNYNIKFLKKKFHLKNLQVIPDPSLLPYDLVVQ